MANLFLNVYRNKIWFKNEKLKSHKVKVVGKFCSIDNLNSSMLEELKNSILEIKNTWIEFECSFFNDTYYADIVITFHNDELTEEDVEINKKVILKCGDFLESNHYKMLDESINNSAKLTEVLDSDGFIIEIEDNEEDGCLDKNHLEKIFCNNKISYNPMSINILNSNNGMRCQRERLFYFIKSNGHSDVTYDLLKTIIRNSDIPIDSIMLNDIKKYDFYKLRKIINHRIGDHDKAIVLTKCYGNRHKFHLEFRAYNNKICLTCDNKYDVIDFELLNDGL